MHLGGKFMLDGAIFAFDDELKEDVGTADDNIQIRRIRIFVAGVFGKRFQFKTEWDFTGFDGGSVKDNYLGITEIPFFQTVRFGQQKEPFGLERMTSSKYLLFMERSLADALAPRHNFGILTFRTLWKERFRWQAGFFFETDNFAASEGDATGLTARVTGTPFWNSETGHLLHLGFSYSNRNQLEETSRLASRPEAHLSPFFVHLYGV